VIKTGGSPTKANFSVSFERLLKTQDAKDDYELKPKIEFTLYAFGSISGGAVQPCTPANRGLKYLDLTAGFVEVFPTNAVFIKFSAVLMLGFILITNGLF